MKIFLIGSFDSIYMFQYVKEVLCDHSFSGNKEYYFFHSGPVIKDEYLRFYEGVACKIYYEKPYRWINRSLIYALKDVAPIDVVHIHYIKLGYYRAIKKMRKRIKKVILTAWGSDLLRLDNKFNTKMKKFIESADIISAGTDNLKNFVVNTLYINETSKIREPKFGSPVIEEIGYLKKNDGKYKDKIGADSSQFVIACGYNGGPEQQHIKIIQALGEMDNIYKPHVFIHIPVAYGLSSDYCDVLEKELDKLGISYNLDKTFYNPREMAAIRLATDIFIHAQTTDASSSSVFEYIYADAVLVNGKWLHYPEIDEYGLSIKEFNEFSEIIDIVENILDNYKKEQEKVKRNNEILLAIRSWSNLKKAWQELY